MSTEPIPSQIKVLEKEYATLSTQFAKHKGALQECESSMLGVLQKLMPLQHKYLGGVIQSLQHQLTSQRDEIKKLQNQLKYQLKTPLLPAKIEEITDTVGESTTGSKSSTDPEPDPEHTKVESDPDEPSSESEQEQDLELGVKKTTQIQIRDDNLVLDV